MRKRIKAAVQDFISHQAALRPLITTGVIAGAGFIAGLIVRGWFA